LINQEPGRVTILRVYYKTTASNSSRENILQHRENHLSFSSLRRAMRFPLCRRQIDAFDQHSLTHAAESGTDGSGSIIEANASFIEVPLLIQNSLTRQNPNTGSQVPLVTASPFHLRRSDRRVANVSEETHEPITAFRAASTRSRHHLQTSPDKGMIIDNEQPNHRKDYFSRRVEDVARPQHGDAGPIRATTFDGSDSTHMSEPMLPGSGLFSLGAPSYCSDSEEAPSVNDTSASEGGCLFLPFPAMRKLRRQHHFADSVKQCESVHRLAEFDCHSNHTGDNEGSGRREVAAASTRPSSCTVSESFLDDLQLFVMLLTSDLTCQTCTMDDPVGNFDDDFTPPPIPATLRSQRRVATTNELVHRSPKDGPYGRSDPKTLANRSRDRKGRVKQQ
jgi:hypothetical protein